MNIKHYKKDNFNLNVLQTNKFKNTRIEISFSNDLAKETATKRAILPYLLKAISKKYPTRASLQTHLEEMYGANFGAGIKKIGLTQVITFDLSIINNDFTLENEDLFLDGITFLKEVILNPLFSEDIFNEEKRLLKEYFQGIYANKMRYAIKRTMENMYEGETFGIDTFGMEAELDDLTLNDCINAYNDMIQNDVINVNIVGDIDLEEVNIILEKELNFSPRSKKLTLIDNSEKPKRDTKEVFDNQNVNQGKIVVGYQFPVYYQTDDYYKAIVLNTMIGGGPESLLFRRIREELSLVYFIGSVYDNHKGSFMIYAGINQEEYQNVKKEINNTFKHVQNQEYPDKALTIAKKSIISSLIQSLDSSSSLIARINNLSLFDKEFDEQELINNINNVTKDDLTSLIPKLKEDVSYLLRNDNLENN